MRIGAARECEPCAEQLLSSYFLIRKSSGKMRFILNLKLLNKFIDTEHFKMEDIRTVTRIVSQSYFLATLDLQDTYILLPMYQNSKKFLRFAWTKKIYEFQYLPFGFCTAPWIFTKIIKPVINHLRFQRWISVYLDDY